MIASGVIIQQVCVEQQLVHRHLSTEQEATIEDHHGQAMHLHGRQEPVPHDGQLDVLLLDQQHPCGGGQQHLPHQ